LGEGVIEEHRLEELLVEKFRQNFFLIGGQDGEAQFIRRTHEMGTHNLPDEHTKCGRTILPDEHTKWGRTILPDEHTEWGRTICQTNTQYLKLFPWCVFSEGYLAL